MDGRKEEEGEWVRYRVVGIGKSWDWNRDLGMCMKG